MQPPNASAYKLHVDNFLSEHGPCPAHLFWRRRRVLGFSRQQSAHLTSDGGARGPRRGGPSARAPPLSRAGEALPLRHSRAPLAIPSPRRILAAEADPERRPGVRGEARREAPKGREEGEAEEEQQEEAAAEKALEALFAQLEMDLNSEDGDAEEEFTDEDLEQMTRELEAVFSGLDLEGLEDEEEEEEEEDDEEEEDEDEDEEGDGVVDMVMKDGVYSEASGAAKTGSRQAYEEEEDEDEDEEFDDDEERLVPLEKWQIRKLVAAAEKGRRHVNVKSLAAEIGMDRSDVLSFLKDPPPELLVMAAHWDSEDARAGTASIPELGFEFKVNVVDEAPRTTTTTRRQPMSPSGGPQVPRSWNGNKRLKKEHIATFERVYRQSSRPSNAMIENLVNLTHVPRKKILQWFDDKRAENQPRKQSFGEAPRIDASTKSIKPVT